MGKRRRGRKVVVEMGRSERREMETEKGKIDGEEGRAQR